MRRFADKQGTRDYERLTKLKIAFVGDESHRAVTSAKTVEINGLFHHALWVWLYEHPIFGAECTQRRGKRPPNDRGTIWRTTAMSIQLKKQSLDGVVLAFKWSI